MYIPTTFNQNRETGPALYYTDAKSDEYLSDSNSCIDNGSDLGSDDYNNCKSNYESDNKKTPCASTSIIGSPSVQLPNVEEQKANITYTLRQEKFNDNFF